MRSRCPFLYAAPRAWPPGCTPGVGRVALHRPLCLIEKKTSLPRAWGVRELLALPYVHPYGRLRAALLDPCPRRAQKASACVCVLRGRSRTRLPGALCALPPLCSGRLTTAWCSRGPWEGKALGKARVSKRGFLS